MRQLFILSLLLVAWIAAAAQPTVTITGPATVTAGSSATVTLTLAGSTGLNLTGLQWTHALPVGATLGTPVASGSSTTAGKGLYCGTTVCVAVGLVGTTITNTPFADGAISSVPIAFASNAPLGSQSLQINGTFAANNLGAAVVIVPGATYSITVLSRCDVNGDGAINSLDVTAVINGINGKGSCPLSGGCNLQSVVAVVIAALGGACSL